MFEVDVFEHPRFLDGIDVLGHGPRYNVLIEVPIGIPDD